ncbi:MAG: NUDIX hydrolase [bacterium]|nr:NUDIX hydrolase [bacterium]
MQRNRLARIGRLWERYWGIGSLMALGLAVTASGAELPPGYWSAGDIEPILERTLIVRLKPDLSGLTEAERMTVDDLLAAGRILHRLYLESVHPQSLEALAELEAKHDELAHSEEASRVTGDLLDLFRVFKGPIATTLDNRRTPFLPVAAEVPGKNVYPADVTREELRAWLEEHPEERDSILDVRSVVRRVTPDKLEADLAALEGHSELALMHPRLGQQLAELAAGLARSDIDAQPTGFYAVPYSVGYADEILEVYDHLRHAAETIRPEDADFAAYLGNRARDLLADDYEAGDASWVRGRFGRLNGQIGSYETYDDELLGVKSFFSANVLLRDEERTDKLAAAIGGLQRLEDSLPYGHHKRVSSDIPVGVYHVIADFGQARGTNTATILPNDADHARKYGRTIMLRYNIMTHPDLFANTKAGWAAAVAPGHADDLTLEGNFNRTLWHEVGHYLGPSATAEGGDLAQALAESSDLIEELKSDLVSLYAAPALAESGYYDAAGLRSVYADGVRRTLQAVKPRRAQPYQTMQLMQMNFFLEHGLLSWSDDGRLTIDYESYHETVAALLAEVLAIQSTGDAERAGRLVDKYAVWDDARHEPLAQRIRAAAKYRYRLVRYAALGE